MYSSTLSLTSNSNIKQNIPLSYCPCQLLRDIFLPSTKSTAVVVIIFICIWWVLSSDLNLLHEALITKCKGKLTSEVGAPTSGIPFILIRMLMDTKPQKYYVNVISPMACCVQCLSYVVCSKSIRPLVGKNTIIYFDVWNPNPLQSSLLGNAHTSSSSPAIAGNISGKLPVESYPAGLSLSE